MLFGMLVIPVKSIEAAGKFKVLLEKVRLDLGLEGIKGEKYVKWFAIGGTVLGGVLGAATMGVGGLIVGAAVGATAATYLCHRYVGVDAKELWKSMFPKFKLPFKYNRQNQAISSGNSLPSASGIVTNKVAPAMTRTKQAVKQSLHKAYQKAYIAYTQAVQQGKPKAILIKLSEKLQRAKQKLMNVFR
jgi:hypothetical protein